MDHGQGEECYFLVCWFACRDCLRATVLDGFAIFPESIAKGSSGKSFEHLHFDTCTYTHTHWKSESIQVRSMPVSKYASVSMQA